MSDTEKPYESQRAVREYLLFHYGTTEEILSWSFGPAEALDYPVRCARIAIEACAAPPQRSLDLGCAVGRSSFELARSSAEVIGIDRSHPFVEAACVLQAQGELTYARTDQGERTSSFLARVPEDIDRDRVSFQVGDAANPPEDLGSFDLVFAANLLDRLGNPGAFLKGLEPRVRPGGTLFLSSPYTWLSEFTPRENWLGGRPDSPQTAEVMQHALGSSFTLIEKRDLPFLIREHERKYQWSVAEATIWRR